ncbi:MAG: hypothetical protein ACJ74Z_10625 [Bryobacteraceae bacterium]
MRSLTLICSVVAVSLSHGAVSLETGEPVDVARFALSKTSDGHLGLEWDEPRVIRRVEIAFPEKVPDPAAVHVDAWVSNWPPKSAGGWIKSDTRWQGDWREVAAEKSHQGDALYFQFKPLTEAENPNAENVPGYAPSFRKTLKLRVRFDRGPVRYSALRAYGESRWNEREIDVETGCEGKPHPQVSASAYNGEVIHTSVLPTPRRGLRLRVRYTEHPPESADRTVVTITSGDNAFGVSMDDIVTKKDLYVRPFGIFIGDTVSGASFRSFVESGRMRVGDDIMSRVSREPEQSLQRATSQIPKLAMTSRLGSHRLRYYPLGFPGSREKYGLDYNGNLFISKKSSKAMKEDLAGMLWEGDQIYFRLGTGDMPDFRERENSARQELLEGWLPLVNTHWADGGLLFEEQAYSTLLDAPLDDQRLRGNEPSVTFLKLRVGNPQSHAARAHIWFMVSPREELRYDRGLLLGAANSQGPYAHPRLRAKLQSAEGSIKIQSVPGRAAPLEGQSAGSNEAEAAVWTVDLPAAASSTLSITVPFRTFESTADQARIRRYEFGARRDETLDYWRKQSRAGVHMRVPDAEFNRFQMSALQHILVTTEKDLKTGYDICPCGTYDYNMFANETALQVRLLDMRGLHDLAWRCLKPIVELQGSKPAPGRFKDTSAMFHGVRVDADHDYTHSGYNLNHGWILWALAEHYFFTRDKAWLRTVMPRIVRAADWIIKERQATKSYLGGHSPAPEYGLLPAGQLEDNEDFEYWFAVNGYAYRGLSAASQALSDTNPATSLRLAHEAAEYREDIRNATFRAMAITPVVPLRDGTWVPAVPPRTSLHGRDLGWIRNILYGSLTLVDCGVFTPSEPVATWILQDYEDNLFMAEDSMAVPERDWFSRGAITLQPNLVNTPAVYMQRNQTPQALRALYNTFAVSYYRDLAAYTEWVPSLGLGGGPFFKTSDEAAFLTFVRLMLVREQGNSLCLNCGAPRQWLRQGAVIEILQAPTYLGHVGFRIESREQDGFVDATVTFPPDLRAQQIELRMRHPEGKKISTVHVDGKNWDGFDAANASIVLPVSTGTRHVHAEYR